MITDQTMHQLNKWQSMMHCPDGSYAMRAKEHWDSISKPLDSLGVFEHQIIRIAACTQNVDVRIDPARLIVMCADNGIVNEGVTQTGQQVTAVVSREIANGRGNVSRMAGMAGVDVEVINTGIAEDIRDPKVINRCIRRGTEDFLNTPALTEEDLIKAINTGVEAVERAKKDGMRMLLAGEMGIGNTTTSTALASALLGIDPDDITGRGAGLSDEGLETKRKVIKKGLKLYGYMSDDGTVDPAVDRDEVFELMCRMGGLDIAGLCGVYLGASIYDIPILLDGLITAVSALCAKRIFHGCEGYMIASHVGKEPAMKRILDELELDAPINAGLALGEGSGAVMGYELLKSSLAVYNGATFSDMKLDSYDRFD